MKINRNTYFVTTDINSKLYIIAVNYKHGEYKCAYRVEGSKYWNEVSDINMYMSNEETRIYIYIDGVDVTIKKW